jgi:hypothetical protein
MDRTGCWTSRSDAVSVEASEAFSGAVGAAISDLAFSSNGRWLNCGLSEIGK